MHDSNFNNKNTPDWLDRVEYPFDGHFLILPIGRMHYIDEGEGEPVVMLHGNCGWSFEYRNIIKELSKSKRCIAPDHIGFGLSDKPESWDYLPIHHAENFERLIVALGLNNITLVVNDWGGPIGLDFAIKHPEKIKKLVILNTWLWSVEKDWYYQMFSGVMGGAFGKFMTRNFNLFGKMVVKQAMGDKSKLTHHIHKHYYEHLEKPSDRKGAYVFPREIIKSSAWLNSLWQQREKINHIPTTFIWGMKDIAFREKELNYWIQNWHNPKVIRLAEAGHYPQEEAPEIVIEELKKG